MVSLRIPSLIFRMHMDKLLSMVSMMGVFSMGVCSDMVYCSFSFIFYVRTSGYSCMFLIESPDNFFIVLPVFLT